MHVSKNSYSIVFFIGALFCVRTCLVSGSPTRLQPVEHLSSISKSPVPRFYTEFDGSSDLVKRQCVKGTKKNKNGNLKWTCDGIQVTLAQIREKITSHGYALGRITMFYTALGGAKGVQASKCWADKHPQWIPKKQTTGTRDEQAGYVMFDRVCDNGWTGAVVRDAGVDGDNVLKCKSQALAEQADGDVYFFIPKGVTAIDESAWIGWELPALQRNKKVTNVWRVDPRDSEWEKDQYDASNSKRVKIWEKGGLIDTPEPRCKA